MIEFLNAEEFFNVVRPLFTFQGNPKKEDVKILNEWLEAAQENFNNEFLTQKHFIKFIRKLNYMMKSNRRIRFVVVSYVKYNRSFTDFFLSYTKCNFLDFDKSCLCNILQFCAYVQIFPNEIWLSIWFQQTNDFLPLFNKKDSYKSLEAVCSLYQARGQEISKEWMKEWFLNSENHIEIIPAYQLIHILSFLGRLHVEPPLSWMEKYKKRVPDLLEEFVDRKRMGLNCLFLFSDAFNIAEVRKNNKLLSVWFDESFEAMNDIHSHFITGSLLSLAHTHVLVPIKWIDATLERIMIEVDISRDRSSLLKEIANALYALTLMNIDIVYCQSFLDKCNIFFKKYEKSVFCDTENVQFRKIIFSRNYFDLIGFKLAVDPWEYESLNNRLQTKARTSSKEQNMFGAVLKTLFGASLKEEAYIPLIVDCSDFLIEEHRLVIEIDGFSHRIDGIENALTRTKSFMLRKDGYKVVRFPAQGAYHDIQCLLENRLSADIV